MSLYRCSTSATVHTATYTPAANTSANDMGASHSYRYVNTSGMVKPSGTYSAGTYSSNGTYTVSSLNNYAAVTFTVDVSSGGGSGTTTQSYSNSDTGNVTSKTQTFSAGLSGYTLIGAALKQAQVYSVDNTTNVLNWTASVSVSGNTITLKMVSNNARTFRCSAGMCKVTAFYVKN